MKTILLLCLTLIFSSCSIKSKSYYLLEGDKTILQTHPKPAVIGIAKIELPRYFNQNDLAVKASDNRVIFIQKANWISDMDEQLTTTLIRYLKRYFNTTDIFYYPWESEKKIQTIVKLRIENFIYQKQKGEVILDASWEIRGGGHSKAKFFHTQIPSADDSDAIVKAMDKAFAKLELQIARSLQSIK